MHSLKLFLLIVWIIIGIIACQQTDSSADAFHLPIPLGLETADVYIPEDNPLELAKIKLGQKLFFDTRLSRDNTVSCATCHNPLLGFSDGKSLAVGIEEKVGKRHTPTILNRVFSREQFWDGREEDLESQLIHPILNPLEMDNTIDNLLETLNRDDKTRQEFRKVFDTDVTLKGIQQAIASFERILVSGNSPFDRFKNGDNKAISESAKRGFQLFKSKRSNCMVCHFGPNFSDELFHNTGVGADQDSVDLGRFVHTKNDSDKGRFKTPTLRNIARTAPFMHDGSLRTLMDVIEFYDRGGIANPNLSKHMVPLGLTDQEKKDLLEFMRSLSGENPLPTSSNQPLILSGQAVGKN